MPLDHFDYRPDYTIFCLWRCCHDERVLRAFAAARYVRRFTRSGERMRREPRGVAFAATRAVYSVLRESCAYQAVPTCALYA